jgi:hypothetical protein
MSAPAVAFDLSHLAECAAVRWQPRRAVRVLSVLVGRAGAVFSYSGTSWDAAHVLSRPLRRDQDGAFFFRREAKQ